MSYYVYIITNKTNRVLYTGVTNNLLRRVYVHKNRFVSSFTAKYKVNKLVYYEIYKYINDALRREKQIKAGSRVKKLDLIRSINPEFNDLYNDILS